MRYVYPYDLSRDEAGCILVQFADVPEAHTDGVTEAEAVAGAADALLAALGGCVAAGRDIPSPTAARGRPCIALASLPAAKLALWQAMREAGETRVVLSQRLGIPESSVRRLLDLDHRSHIGAVETALGLLGRRLVLDVQRAA